MVRCKIVGFATLTHGDKVYKAGDIVDLPEELATAWNLPVVPGEPAEPDSGQVPAAMPDEPDAKRRRR